MPTTDLAKRKKSFMDYYTANPDKLKGKSVHDAYAAMRREAGRQNRTSRKADGFDSAIKRRLDQKASPKSSNSNSGRGFRYGKGPNVTLPKISIKPITRHGKGISIPNGNRNGQSNGKEFGQDMQAIARYIKKLKKF